MSSVSNYSVWQLHTIFIARQDAWLKLHDERLAAQQTRLVKHADQTGVLTIEQQNLNKRVSEVCNALAATRKMLSKLVGSKFDDYVLAQPIDQPGIRVQIDALIDDMGMKMRCFEGKIRELEGIDVADA